MINYIRQWFCKHEIVDKKSTFPTQRFKSTLGGIYNWDEHVTIIYCKHCGYSKTIKEH